MPARTHRERSDTTTPGRAPGRVTPPSPVPELLRRAGNRATVAALAAGATPRVTVQRYVEQELRAGDHGRAHLETEAQDLRWRRRTPEEAREKPAEIPWTADSDRRVEHARPGVVLRVSDDGRLAVHRAGPARQAKEFYGTREVVGRSTEALRATGSWWGLSTTDATVTVSEPRTGRARRLERVVPITNQDTCSAFSRDVYNTCDAVAQRVIGATRAHLSLASGTTPEGSVEERWQAVTSERASGARARPAVGEAFFTAMRSEIGRPAGAWDSHWAGVLARSGQDRVTIENFKRAGADEAVRDLHRSLLVRYRDWTWRTLLSDLFRPAAKNPQGPSDDRDIQEIRNDLPELIRRQARLIGVEAGSEIKRLTESTVHQNTMWYLAMYGEKSGQSFHEVWAGDAPNQVYSGATATVRRRRDTDDR